MLSLAPMPAYGGTSAASRSLTSRQKAAVIVRLVLSQGAKLPISGLSDDMQTDLTEEIGRMRSIDRDTLHSVIQEFVAALDGIGLTFSGGIEGALTLMDGHLSPVATSRLRRMIGSDAKSDPWERISAIDATRLLPVLAAESTEVGAVLLSKLAVSKAAELLGKLPGEKARRIAYAVSLTGSIAPAAVLRIGQSLAMQLDAQPVLAFDTGPVERVGAILNYTPANTRDEVLDGLEEDDKGFADQVRKAIFTFTNIPVRIDARDIPKIIRNVDAAVLVTALAGAKDGDLASAEFILANISQRMATNMREEIENLGKVKDKDAEAAMATVVAAIREMEAAGDLFLVAGEDEND